MLDETNSLETGGSTRFPQLARFRLIAFRAMKNCQQNKTERKAVMNAALKSPATAPGPKAPKRLKEKILLVDDDPAIRQLLTRLLAEEGYVVISAANGVEAVERTESTKFDLALLDLNMPVMDDWEAFQKIKSKNPLLPFIVITARPNQLFPAAGSGTGALMDKPLDLPKLFNTIRTLINEPAKVRLARMVGRPAEFHYVPPKADEPERRAG